MSKAVLAGFVVFFGAYHVYSQSQPLELKEGPEALRHGATMVFLAPTIAPPAGLSRADTWPVSSTRQIA
jgi:hypothetical protein